jgi:hypothetical protein
MKYLALALIAVAFILAARVKGRPKPSRWVLRDPFARDPWPLDREAEAIEWDPHSAAIVRRYGL